MKAILLAVVIACAGCSASSAEQPVLVVYRAYSTFIDVERDTGHGRCPLGVVVMLEDIWAEKPPKSDIKYEGFDETKSDARFSVILPPGFRDEWYVERVLVWKRVGEGVIPSTVMRSYQSDCNRFSAGEQRFLALRLTPGERYSVRIMLLPRPQGRFSGGAAGDITAHNVKIRSTVTYEPAWEEMKVK